MNIRRLYVVTLWAPDVAATAHFYRDVLGLPLQAHGGRPHLQVGETLMAILQSEGRTSQAGQSVRFPAVAFEVEDLDTAVAELQAQGVELPWGVEQDSDSRWVMFYDPTGNLVELAETVKAPARPGTD